MYFISQMDNRGLEPMNLIFLCDFKDKIFESRHCVALRGPKFRGWGLMLGNWWNEPKIWIFGKPLWTQHWTFGFYKLLSYLVVSTTKLAMAEGSHIRLITIHLWGGVEVRSVIGWPPRAIAPHNYMRKEINLKTS